MKRLLTLLLTLYLLAHIVVCAQTPPEPEPEPAVDPVFQRIDEIVAELSQITGLRTRHHVPHDVINREGLEEFLKQRVQDEIDPEELRIEELLLKKLGFVPEEFDLKETMIDLYTEQAAAFYDFHKKRLFILESDDSALQETALVHELAHALADQHFKLGKFLHGSKGNDDAAMARMAVMEGQATWLMSEFMVRRMGKSLVDSPEMVKLMSRMMGGSGPQFPVFDGAPLYLRESLLFPYTSGFQFQHAVVERYGKNAFARVFQKPPDYTQQVIHPETYFDPIPRRKPKLPRLRHENRYNRLAEGILGEFDFAVLLRQFGTEDDVRRIAPAWRDARYRLLEHKKDQHTVLIHASVWESSEVARDFFRRYHTILEQKWAKFSLDHQSDNLTVGAGDDGIFVLRVEDATVYTVEGLRSPEDLRR